LDAAVMEHVLAAQLTDVDPLLADGAGW